ncbi:hypothetical protein B0H21DRAFT_165475 [Amylocystis lapponica]|nr:hypothetical protein B0H21DRAFT_165475 [Amylocystis lapponica]
MARFSRVFVGAPTPQDVAQPLGSYRWQTASSSTPPIFTLPPATVEEASRRISLLYHNIIFRDSDEDEADMEDSEQGQHNSLEHSHQDETTAITWPPTAKDATASQIASHSEVTFLPLSASISRIRSQHGETQETQETTSYNYSDASSIARFPAFHFSLHTLTALSTLITHAQAQTSTAQKGSQKVTVLVAVLEVDGPDSIRIKKGPEAGKEVALLKLILGAEDGVVCKLTAWREVAETWGGACFDTASSGVKRGDIVLLANVLASWEPTLPDAAAGSPLAFTASPALKSTLEICYRTMPSAAADARLRPDLRLGLSDAAVRKVAAAVDWFERMAGLPPN